jgi:hypothetical protein
MRYINNVAKTMSERAGRACRSRDDDKRRLHLKGGIVCSLVQHAHPMVQRWVDNIVATDRRRIPNDYEACKEITKVFCCLHRAKKLPYERLTMNKYKEGTPGATVVQSLLDVLRDDAMGQIFYRECKGISLGTSHVSATGPKRVPPGMHCGLFLFLSRNLFMDQLDRARTGYVIDGHQPDWDDVNGKVDPNKLDQLECPFAILYFEVLVARAMPSFIIKADDESWGNRLLESDDHCPIDDLSHQARALACKEHNKTLGYTRKGTGAPSVHSFIDHTTNVQEALKSACEQLTRRLGQKRNAW